MVLINIERVDEYEDGESREDESTPAPRIRLPGLDLLKPPDIFGLGRERDRKRERHKDQRRNQDSEQNESSEETDTIRDSPMSRSLDLRRGEKNEGNKEQTENSQSQEPAQKREREYGPCGQNNEYCSGENYIKELGLQWSLRTHNGTGIYLRDKYAPGGKRYVLVGIEMVR